MAATRAIRSVGCTLEYDSSGWNSVGDITNLVPFDANKDAYDVTHLASPGNTKEYLPGLLDNGTCTVDLCWNPSNTDHDFMYDNLALTTGETISWRVTHTDSGATVATFSGFVKKVSPTIAVASQITASVEIQITGQITWS